MTFSPLNAWTASPGRLFQQNRPFADIHNVLAEGARNAVTVIEANEPETVVRSFQEVSVGFHQLMLLFRSMQGMRECL